MTEKWGNMRADALKRRCPRLGSRVSFTFCLTGGGDQKPCWKIYDCWWEIFDVAAYLEAHLSAEALEDLRSRAASPPGNKLASIIEIARQAKNPNNE
jgi:hypothetical protein